MTFGPLWVLVVVAVAAAALEVNSAVAVVLYEKILDA